MIVVLDSNVWLSELGLKSGAAAAVRFFLNQSNAQVAVPEVVQLEVRHNLTNRLSTHTKEIRDNYRQLLTAFGKLREIVLPTEEEIHAKVEELFASLGVQQQQIPFSLESARSALLKAIQKAPPCDKSQEFKDAVIWSDCIALLATDEVVLVTNDKAFYRDRAYEKGLAANLQNETKDMPHQLRILPSLSDLLEVIQAPVPLEEDQLQEAIFEAFGESINGTLARTGFSLGARQNVTHKLFATENPSELFLEFSIAISCVDLREESRINALLSLNGDGLYSPTNRTFAALRNFGEHLAWVNANGDPQETRNVRMYASGLVIGHREVAHEVRHALPANER
jgi:predicted nucleic acid-binding protein